MVSQQILAVVIIILKLKYKANPVDFRAVHLKNAGDYGSLAMAISRLNQQARTRT